MTLDLSQAATSQQVLGMIWAIGWRLVVWGWIVGGIWLASFVAAYQERQIWLPPGLPNLTLLGMAKVVLFNVLWCTSCLIGSTAIVFYQLIILALGGPFLLFASSVGNDHNGNPGRGWYSRCREEMAEQAHYVSWWTAHLCVTVLIGMVQVHGLEHLPPLVDSSILSDGTYNDDDDDDNDDDNAGQNSNTTTVAAVISSSPPEQPKQLKQEKEQEQEQPQDKPLPQQQQRTAVRNTGRRRSRYRRHAIPAPVYVANHASQLDVAVVYFVLTQDRRFQWIAKQSIALLPGVGQIAILAQNILIAKRKKKNMNKTKTQTPNAKPQSKPEQSPPEQSLSPTPPTSQSPASHSPYEHMFVQAKESVSHQGIPVVFFPQGTRWMADRLPLKDGAFIVAQTNQSPLVPISIDIPPHAWNSYYPFMPLYHWLVSWIGGGIPSTTTNPTTSASNTNSTKSSSMLWTSTPVITLTVHPPVNVTDYPDRQTLKDQIAKVIYQAVPNILMAEGSLESPSSFSSMATGTTTTAATTTSNGPPSILPKQQ